MGYIATQTRTGCCGGARRPRSLRGLGDQLPPNAVNDAYAYTPPVVKREPKELKQLGTKMIELNKDIDKGVQIAPWIRQEIWPNSGILNWHAMAGLGGVLMLAVVAKKRR